MRADRWSWLERVLLVVGLACLSWYGYVQIEAAQYQREQAAALETLLESAAVSGTDVLISPEPATPAIVPHASPVPPTTPPAAFPTPPAPSTRTERASIDPNMIGLLEIPRLRLSTVVASGDDAATLKVAAGHLRDTPRPWEPGNSAIAAHRDSFFRPLKHIRVGDEVRMRTMRGEFAYKVRDIKIVPPTDLSVLKPGDEDSLTLITCYPFNYIGAAPMRYIVRAERSGGRDDRINATQ